MTPRTCFSHSFVEKNTVWRDNFLPEIKEMDFCVEVCEKREDDQMRRC